MPTILIVDNFADDCKAMKRGAEDAIAALGGHVETASDAESAIKRLTEEVFDVVVTDLQLTLDKKYEGWDVLQYAKKLNAATKIIVVTKYTEEDTKAKSMELGAYGYMDKIKADLVEQTKEIVADVLRAG